jgi:acetyl-CoA C-acetyltransferase
MAEVVIAGLGITPVGEHWELSLRNLAARAISAALKDAGGLRPQALYIGNYLGSIVSHQANMGALITDNSGLSGIESYTVEAAEASSAGAFRVGYLAVASGCVDTALVLGVEKYTDVTDGAGNALGTGLDWDYESVNGVLPVTLAALVMQCYLGQYQAPRQAFAGLPLLAHANAVNNPKAMYRKPIRREAYEQAAMVSDPLNLYDIAPYADGAAAVLITRRELVPDNLAHALVKVMGSSVVTDRLALHDRFDPLAFEAAALSVERACSQAGILPKDVSFFELDDAFSIYGVLALEAAGFARRGEGWKLLNDGSLEIKGRLPALTMGGSKARGNPPGAAGLYQIAEAALQLRGQAGASQVAGARRALVQSLGGPASTAITHVLEKAI